jgi:hypothetical protein
VRVLHKLDIMPQITDKQFPGKLRYRWKLRKVTAR